MGAKLVAINAAVGAITDNAVLAFAAAVLKPPKADSIATDRLLGCSFGASEMKLTLSSDELQGQFP
jgi:hypothetical protein